MFDFIFTITTGLVSIYVNVGFKEARYSERLCQVWTNDTFYTHSINKSNMQEKTYSN